MHVVATAGHVDHGKSTLVRALTGMEPDRHEEERRRGMTIDLGFAWTTLPGGEVVAFVDVPGHERFVPTMLAGVGPVPAVLLVVAADEGWMPQTAEHVAALDALGVRHALLVVTRSDLADPGPTAADVRARLAGTSLAGPPAVAVSARTGAGLDDLRAALAEVAREVPRHEANGATRLYVDRAFTLRGIGTVATGTLWSGTVGEGDALRVEPGSREVRVRSVQVHDRPLERADAGQRVAVALPGVERSELGRGDALVTPGAFPVSYRLDVALEELAEIPSRVHVHHGTAEVPARVVRVGERWAQLRLSSQVVAARGDRVVLRAATTVGGGTVIDPAPPRHASAERMELVERGEIASTVFAPVRADELRGLGDTDGLVRAGDWVLAQEWLDELRAELERRIAAADPLDPGVPPPAEPWSAAVVPLLGLERRGSKLYLPGAAADLGARADAAAALEAELGLEPVKVEDAALARYLEEQGSLVRVGDGYAVSGAAYAEARDALVAECEAAGSITLARFRDLLGVGRRTAQLLLERFDADGLTRRTGDARVLRRRGTIAP